MQHGPRKIFGKHGDRLDPMFGRLFAAVSGHLGSGGACGRKPHQSPRVTSQILSNQAQHDLVESALFVAEPDPNSVELGLDTAELRPVPAQNWPAPASLGRTLPEFRGAWPSSGRLLAKLPEITPMNEPDTGLFLPDQQLANSGPISAEPARVDFSHAQVRPKSVPTRSNQARILMHQAHSSSSQARPRPVQIGRPKLGRSRSKFGAISLPVRSSGQRSCRMAPWGDVAHRTLVSRGPALLPAHFSGASYRTPPAHCCLRERSRGENKRPSMSRSTSEGPRELTPPEALPQRIARECKNFADFGDAFAPSPLDTWARRVDPIARNIAHFRRCASARQLAWQMLKAHFGNDVCDISLTLEADVKEGSREVKRGQHFLRENSLGIF